MNPIGILFGWEKDFLYEVYLIRRIRAQLCNFSYKFFQTSFDDNYGNHVAPENIFVFSIILFGAMKQLRLHIHVLLIPVDFPTCFFVF